MEAWGQNIPKGLTKQYPANTVVTPYYYVHSDSFNSHTLNWPSVKKTSRYIGINYTFGSFSTNTIGSFTKQSLKGVGTATSYNMPQSIWPANTLYTNFLANYNYTVRQNTSLGQLTIYYNAAKYQSGFRSHPSLRNKNRNPMASIAFNLLLNTVLGDSTRVTIY